MRDFLETLPVVLFVAGLLMTAALVGRRLLRRSSLTRALVMGAVGLALTLACSPAGVLVSTLAASYVAGEPRWKHVAIPPTHWLLALAWGLLGAAVVSALGIRLRRLVHRAPGPASSDVEPFSGPNAARVAPEILVAGLVIASSSRLSDRLEDRLWEQVKALHDGSSVALWKSQSLPLAVGGLESVQVEAIAIGLGAGDPIAVAVDPEGRIHTWSPETGLASTPVLTPGGPVRMGGVSGGSLCGSRGNATASCWELTPGRRGIEERLFTGIVRSVQATSECGREAVCVVSDRQTGACWDRRTGQGPEQAFPGTAVTLLAPGFICGQCAALVQGGVRCEGRVAFASLSGEVKGLGPVVALSVSAKRGCAIEAGGALRCWENPRSPDEGVDPEKEAVRDWPSHWQARPYLAEVHVDEVAVNDDHVCARAGTRVHCWGDNTWGQLCDGTTTSSESPREVDGVSDAVAIAVSWGVTCLAHARGGVSCCGKHARRPAIKP